MSRPKPFFLFDLHKISALQRFQRRVTHRYGDLTIETAHGGNPVFLYAVDKLSHLGQIGLLIPFQEEIEGFIAHGRIGVMEGYLRGDLVPRGCATLGAEDL